MLHRLRLRIPACELHFLIKIVILRSSSTFVQVRGHRMCEKWTWWIVGKRHILSSIDIYVFLSKKTQSLQYLAYTFAHICFYAKREKQTPPRWFAGVCRWYTDCPTPLFNLIAFILNYKLLLTEKSLHVLFLFFHPLVRSSGNDIVKDLRPSLRRGVSASR